MKRIRLKLIIILKSSYWSPAHIPKLLPRTRSIQKIAYLGAHKTYIYIYIYIYNKSSCQIDQRHINPILTSFLCVFLKSLLRFTSNFIFVCFNFLLKWGQNLWIYGAVRWGPHFCWEVKRHVSCSLSAMHRSFLCETRG